MENKAAKIFLIFLTILAAFSFFKTQTVNASALDNVSGWAWSNKENIGWISFNNTNNLGLGWTDLGSQFDGGAIDSLASPGNGIALAGTGTGHILRSTDYGATWSDLGQQFSEPAILSLIYLENGIALAGTMDPDLILGGKILRSTDYGATWSDLGQQFAQTGIYSLSYLENGIALAGTGSNGKILRSTDYGATWSDLGQQFSLTRIQSLAYLGNGIALAGTLGGRILRSTDYGATWSNLGQQFSQSQIPSLVSLGGGIALAGTYSGGKILRSTDYGATWSDLGKQFTASKITSLFYLGNGIALAGMYDGARVFRSVDFGVTWSDLGHLGPLYVGNDIYSFTYLGNGIALAGGSTLSRSTDYGVNVDNSGAFSGHAWSENIGWISFNKAETGVPPGPPYNGAETYIAKYDSGTNEISGWARALAACKDSLWDGVKCTGAGAGDKSGGWDGWIKLRKYATDAGAAYGVSVNKAVSPNQFTGWAWGGSDVVGWISFNCSNQGVCAASDYKVLGSLNGSPYIEALSQVVDSLTYCGISNGTGQTNLRWTYKDPDSDPETRFELQIDNNADFLTPEVNRNITGLSNPSPTTNTQSAYIKITPAADELAYNTTYHWRVRVYDNQGNNSGWSNGTDFTTAASAKPWPSFTYIPASPKVDQEITFTNTSACYDASNNQVACSSWLWTFGDGNTSVLKDPVHAYTSTGSKQVVLNASYGANSCDSNPTTITVGTFPTPKWQEVPPSSWLDKFFAAIAGIFSKVSNTLNYEMAFEIFL